MPYAGSLQLREYPTAMVRLACTRCSRRGQYRKATLVERHGAEMPLPDLRHEIAKCQLEGKLGSACGIYFADLVPVDLGRLAGLGARGRR